MHAAGKEVNSVDKYKLKLEGLEGSIKVCLYLFSPSHNSRQLYLCRYKHISWWQGKEQGLEGLCSCLQRCRLAGQVVGGRLANGHEQWTPDPGPAPRDAKHEHGVLEKRAPWLDVLLLLLGSAISRISVSPSIRIWLQLCYGMEYSGECFLQWMHMSSVYNVILWRLRPGLAWGENIRLVASGSNNLVAVQVLQYVRRRREYLLGQALPQGPMSLVLAQDGTWGLNKGPSRGLS